MENAAQQQKTGNYKVELCESFRTDGYCPYGKKCNFAHGEADLRLRIVSPRYKTKMCHNIVNPPFYCQYGKRCKFRHPLDDLRPKIVIIRETPPPSGKPRKPLSERIDYPQSNMDQVLQAIEELPTPPKKQK